MEEKTPFAWAVNLEEEIKKDLESLGIEAQIYSPYGVVIKFYSKEDMNLYKISGKYKEDYYLMFLDPETSIEMPEEEIITCSITSVAKGIAKGISYY